MGRLSKVAPVTAWRTREDQRSEISRNLPNPEHRTVQCRCLRLSAEEPSLKTWKDRRTPNIEKKKAEKGGGGGEWRDGVGRGGAQISSSLAVQTPGGNQPQKMMPDERSRLGGQENMPEVDLIQ